MGNRTANGDGAWKIERWLRPLAQLTPHSRLLLAETLSAMLEAGDGPKAVANALGIPRSTAEHRIQRVRCLFGEQLADRNARVQLILALRYILPRWRREAAYARKHPRAR